MSSESHVSVPLNIQDENWAHLQNILGAFSHRCCCSIHAVCVFRLLAGKNPLCLVFLICSSTSFPLPLSYNCILELIILPENCQTPVPARMISLHPSRILGDGWFLLKTFRHPFRFIEWKHFWSDPNKKNTSCWNIFVYSSVYFQLYSSIWLIGSQLKCDDIVGTPVCLTKTVNFRTKAIKSRKTNHNNGRVRRRLENDVSPNECSGSSGPHINRPLWPTVPGLIHPCH